MSHYERLITWGWDPAWNLAFVQAASEAPKGLTLCPARVVGREGPVLSLETPEGRLPATASGRLQFFSVETALPVVGDWVAAQVVGDQAVVHAVLPRRTTFSRAEAVGKVAAGKESVLAANLDVLAIVMGLDGNFNPRRAHRLATLARHGGVRPLWVLTKADLPDTDDKIGLARRVAGLDPVVVLSNVTGEGVEALDPWLKPGSTVGLTGSSGVGKTTLVNRLLGGALATQAVRAADSRGRHTTTSRQLYRLPGGALLMDAPGLRSVGLWAEDDDLAAGFPEIEALAARCRFPDCRHEAEPGCAVREARNSGTLDEARWDAWLRQARELRYLERRADLGTQRAERDRWKAINRSMRGFSKETRSRG